MKRSSHITLVAMGAASFVASFVAGNAVLNWMTPPTNQACTTLADGTKSCRNTTPRASSFTYYMTRPFYSSSDERTTPKASLSNSGATAKAALPAATTRGGFGATASAASSHASVGG